MNDLYGSLSKSSFEEINKLTNDYLHWLKDNTSLRRLENDWVEITTPYLDRHNDCLQIYVRKKNDTYELTDFGYIINDLELSGCSITAKREELLKKTLAGFGVELRDKTRLVINASKDNFPLKKHNLLQAMLSVNDIFYLSDSHVIAVFHELVTHWLDACNIRNTPDVKFSGKTGYDHMFDFVIPKSREQPERILQTINHLSKDAINALLFKWMDTRVSRPTGAILYAIINDREGYSPGKYISALHNYGAKPIFWSRRTEYQKELAA